jgi:2-keto-4-pentenoate hydratase
VEGAIAAFELGDFMYSGTPREVDFIANSRLARAIVLASRITPLEGLDLALEGVVYEQNGQIVGTHTAAEVMGDPLNALAWLANHLHTVILPGAGRCSIISGCISKILYPTAGDRIRARFTRLGSIDITIVP